MLNYNSNYTEKSLGAFTDDVAAHLALQMEGKAFSDGFNLFVSPKNVSYTAFEDDEMNTVRKTLMLLVIAVSEYEDIELLDNKIVELPEDSTATGINQEEGGDLFEEFPLTAKSYCIYLAYHILSEKLSQRNTPLFRILFICTCLEFWRQKIPPEVVVGPIGKDVHWGDLILQLTGNFSLHSQEKFRISGYGGFIDVLKREVESVSTSEVPEIILSHFYSRNGVATKKETLLVKTYLNKIMSESRRK